MKSEEGGFDFNRVSAKGLFFFTRQKNYKCSSYSETVRPVSNKRSVQKTNQ